MSEKTKTLRISESLHAKLHKKKYDKGYKSMEELLVSEIDLGDYER